MIQRQSGKGKQHCPCQCHWDLSWVRFGDSRIAVSDVDGLFVVERRGYFLFIETKGMDEPLTQGQRILLQELGRVPKFTVLVIYGDKGYPTVLHRIERGEFLAIEETSREDFQRRIDIWYGRANGEMVQKRKAAV